MGRILNAVLRGAAVIIGSALCIAVCGVLLYTLMLSSGSKSASATGGVENQTILDKFDMYITNQTSTALDGILSIKKVYWLSDNDEVAPKAKAENYGVADKPEDLMWLLEEAKDLIGDQKMSFNQDIKLWKHGKIHYYYDETILVITWQQMMDGIVHTISEVKIADASQFRRALAGGEFGSDKQFFATQIAQSVNAVVATSGDFYKFRHNGIIVHKGKLRRFEGESVDTCFIDDKGDLLFVKRKELKNEKEAEKYIEDNNVRFSLAFGPVMVDGGKNVVPNSYIIGEINGNYTRSALCQLDQLHYLFVNTSSYPKYGLTLRQSLKQFADHLVQLGADKAYALDGGQTTVIAMDGELISAPDYGYQRQISDIIYFATALPEGG